VRAQQSNMLGVGGRYGTMSAIGAIHAGGHGDARATQDDAWLVLRGNAGPPRTMRGGADPAGGPLWISSVGWAQSVRAPTGSMTQPSGRRNEPGCPAAPDRTASPRVARWHAPDRPAPARGRSGRPNRSTGTKAAVVGEPPRPALRPVPRERRPRSARPTAWRPGRRGPLGRRGAAGVASRTWSSPDSVGVECR